MGLFRRWFGETERTSHEAVASPAAPETLEQQGRRNAVSDESVRSDGEQEEDSRIRAKIQDLLDTAINPAVAGHGGGVSPVDVRDKMVYLQMGGGCQGGGMAGVTPKPGLQNMSPEEPPHVSAVIDGTH